MDKADIVFYHILLLSISGGISVLGIFLVRKLFYNYASKKMFYYLWLIAFFFFLVPMPNLFVFRESFNKNNRYILETENVPAEKENNEQETDIRFLTEKKNEQKEKTERIEQEPLVKDWEEDEKLKEEKKGYVSLAVLRKIEIIWGIGVMSLFGYHIWQGIFFRKRLGKERLETVSQEYYIQVLEVLSKEKQNLQIKELPKIYYHRNISSPFLIGIWKPKICLPVDIPVEDIKIILQHELIHYKRKDLWYQAVGKGIAFFYWFHPLIWLMLIKLEEDCEYSCDEEVIRQMDNDERKNYSKAILMTIYRARNQCRTGKVAFSEKKSFTERRVREIMKERKIKKWAVIGVIFCILGVSSGIYTISAAVKEKFPIQRDISYQVDSQEGIPQERVSGERKNFEADYEEIKKLEVYGYDATVVVKEGEKFSVTANNIELDYKIENKDGTLILADKLFDPKNPWYYSNGIGTNYYRDYNKNAVITIQIPKSLKLESMILFNNGGNFTVENLGTKYLRADNSFGVFEIVQMTAEETYIDGGSGPIKGEKSIFGETIIDTGSGYSSFINCQMKNLNLDTGSGDVIISGMVTGKNIIDTGSGNVILSLYGKKEQYSYEIDSGSGIVKIGGQVYEDGKKGSNRSQSFYIDTGSGDVTIDFGTEVLQTDDKIQQIIKEIENNTKTQAISTQQVVQAIDKEVKTEELEWNGINKIDFNLANSDVYFYVTEDNKIKIIQKMNEHMINGKEIDSTNYVLQEQEIFTAAKIGDCLSIKTENRIPENKFSTNNMTFGTSLYVYLPVSYLKDIAVNTNLGDVIFYDSVKGEEINIITNLGDIIGKKDFEVKNMKLDTNLGDICLDDLIKTNKLEITNNLGDVDIYGKLDVDTIEVSMSLGDMSLFNEVSCNRLKIYSSMGNCTIENPINCDVIDIYITMGSLDSKDLIAPQKRVIKN